MRKLLILSLAVLLTGCSYNQFATTTTGSMMGGMFCSSIGGIIGGPRGYDIGTVVGMVGGGVVGAAIGAEQDAKAHPSRNRNRNNNYHEDYYDYDEVSYDSPRRQDSFKSTRSQWEALEVTRVNFSDENGNRRLDTREHATLILEIYNQGNGTVYDIAPRISCDNSRVAISPTAIFDVLEPGQGFRYKAEIIAPEKLKEEFLTFKVDFGSKKQKVTAKVFRVRTGR